MSVCVCANAYVCVCVFDKWLKVNPLFIVIKPNKFKYKYTKEKQLNFRYNNFAIRKTEKKRKCILKSVKNIKIYNTYIDIWYIHKLKHKLKIYKKLKLETIIKHKINIIKIHIYTV